MPTMPGVSITLALTSLNISVTQSLAQDVDYPTRFISEREGDTSLLDPFFTSNPV